MKRKQPCEPRLVGKGEVAAYSVAGGGQNFCYALITGYLMYYYINVFHIDPRFVSIMLFVEGIWDIVNNPLAGILIDRTRTKRGKMVPYLRTLTFPLAVCTVLMFSGPLLIRDTSPTSPLKIAFMFVTYFFVGALLHDHGCLLLGPISGNLAASGRAAARDDFGQCDD